MNYKTAIIGFAIFSFIGRVQAFQDSVFHEKVDFPFTNMPEVLPGTKRLTQAGDLSVKMLDGAHKFIEEKINQSIANRLKLWNRDFSSREAYEISVEPNRKRFMKYIGVEDKTEPFNNYNSGMTL